MGNKEMIVNTHFDNKISSQKSSFLLQYPTKKKRASEASRSRDPMPNPLFSFPHYHPRAPHLSSAQVADLLGHADTRMVEAIYAITRHEGIMKQKDLVNALNPYAK
ncbi:MAG: hypothetical protein K6F61_10930 [Clostridiales bacterium]|nr:hypothetical protein [Clostridiales bacterium]